MVALSSSVTMTFLPDVIAYSNTVFDKNTNNENFKWYLSAAEEAIKDIVKSGKPRTMVPPDQSKYAAEIPSFLTRSMGTREALQRPLS